MKGWTDIDNDDDEDLGVPVKKIDTTKVLVGKYKGLTPEQIAKDDPKYIVWAYENIPGFCTELLYLACAQQVDEAEDDDEDLGELDYRRFER